MTTRTLSGQNSADDFDDLCNLFVELESCNAPAELHGIICGQLAAGKRLSANDWIALAVEQMQLSELPDEARGMLQELYDQTLKQLLGGEFGLRLLLPDEEDEMPIRAEALGQWCSGFLGGFGLANPKAGVLGEEVVSVLEDLAEIAQIQLDLEESEENEVSLMEVSEYVRMGVMVVYTECNPDAPIIKPSTPSLH
ncbi:UPF0149 family protein [Aestuariirhabdus sp. LZHN29]|uniref:UPF0149 family protein n=1 Tax=Aestuariirhabdus sp. LZHN29 TaxID=3417462 RepID=UPI003CF00F7C